MAALFTFLPKIFSCLPCSTNFDAGVVIVYIIKKIGFAFKS